MFNAKILWILLCKSWENMLLIVWFPAWFLCMYIFMENARQRSIIFVDRTEIGRLYATWAGLWITGYTWMAILFILSKLRSMQLCHFSWKKFISSRIISLCLWNRWVTAFLDGRSKPKLVSNYPIITGWLLSLALRGKINVFSLIPSCQHSVCYGEALMDLKWVIKLWLVCWFIL